MLPSAFVLLETLPLSANGKIDLSARPATKSAAIHSDQDFTAPRTLLEQPVADIFSELLGVEQIDVYDNFFDLGGHSLLIAQLTD